MAYIFDGISKTITLTTGTTSVSVRDLWSRWVDWFLTGDNSKFLPAFTNVGGDDIDISQGTKIPIYSFLMNGWRLRPQEANHTLSINDGILLVNGGGDPFINTTGAYIVRINYQQPVQAISFSTGGGSSIAPTVEQIRQEMDTNSQISLKVDELHKIQGLDEANPMTVTTFNRTAGTINLDFTGNGETETVVTRND
jgi:hypothetical protein